MFIDGGYLEQVLRQEFNSTRIDFSKLSGLLTGLSSHLRTYYYHCLPYQDSPPSAEQSQRVSERQKFYDRLQRLERFEVRLGSLRKRGAGFEQKGVDVMLAIDLVLLSAKRAITQAVLLTADSDFVPAIEVAKNEGVLVTICQSRTIGHNYALLHAADQRLIIDNELVNRVKL